MQTAAIRISISENLMRQVALTVMDKCIISQITGEGRDEDFQKQLTHVT